MAPPPLRHYASTSALPSRYVTEDTPADLLEGLMDLSVILPAGHNVNMQVHRSTPMMDLLIQVTTAHKINPGGHVIHVVSDNRLLTYKPSTPIGTLETTAIQIVPKNKVNEARKNRTHLNTQAIEKNIRLKVNLPRNQLAVYRVPPKTQISEVLQLVCKEKGLDINGYEIRHPVNVDEKLRGVCSLSDYQLQEVTVVPRGYRAPPLSVTDLITMAAISHPEDKKRKGIFSLFSRKTKTSSTGDSSVSSGSAGERSVSPARSDESVDGHPSSDVNLRPLSHASSSTTLTNAPLPPTRPRKRQAPTVPPLPPATAPNPLVNGKADETNRRVEIEKRNGNALSRNSSNSSDNRSSLLSGADSDYSNSDLGRPATNLTSVVSTSSLSLASRGKRRAPVPPKPPPTQDQNTRPSAIPEETDSVHSLSSQDPKIVEENRVNVNGESASSPPASQSSPLTTSPSSPSSSSFVSSVSSLSSVEQQASPPGSSGPPVAPQQPADSNSVEPPPPPETEAPPPPVTECSTNSEGAEHSNAITWDPFAAPTNDNHAQNHTTPSTITHHSTTSIVPPQRHTNNAPSHASSPTAADNTGELHHDKLDLNSNHISSNTKNHIYSDRLAPTTDPTTTHQQQNSYNHHPPKKVSNQTKPARSDKSSRKRSSQEAANSDFSAKQSKEGSGDNREVVDGAKSSSLYQSSKDAIIPQGGTNENLPVIPTFRLVTKSQTAVKGEEETKKKFIADGKQQQVGDDYSGTFGKSSINTNTNKNSRGNILSRQEKISDVEDELDIDEDMFEPRDIFGVSIQSVDLSQLGSPVNSSTPERSSISTPVALGTNKDINLSLKTAKKQAPKPAQRTTVKSSPNSNQKIKTRSSLSSSSSSSSSSSDSDGESVHKNKSNGILKNEIVINSSVSDEKIQVIKPIPPPRNLSLGINKSRPNVPRPQMKKVGSTDSNSSCSSIESKDGRDSSLRIMNGFSEEVLGNIAPVTTGNSQIKSQASTESSVSSLSSQKIPMVLASNAKKKNSTILKASSVDSEESTDIIYHGNLNLSNNIAGDNEIDFNHALEEPSSEDFMVHVSKLSSVDFDMLSLLSEEGVDGSNSSNSSGTTTPVPSNASTLSKGSTALKEIKDELKDSDASKVQNQPEPPKMGLAIGGTSGNLRAGFLAMMEQLKDWDNTNPEDDNDVTPKGENIDMRQSSRKSSSSGSENSSIREYTKNTMYDSDTESAVPQEDFIYGTRTNPLNDFSNIKTWKNSDSLNTLGIDSSDSNRSSLTGSLGGLRGVVEATTLPGGHASGSSLCSNSDNEVQSRTASFSSESSEESQGSKRTMSNPVHNGPTTLKESPKETLKETDTSNIHTNIPQTTKPITLNKVPKQEQHILTKQDIDTNKNNRERSFSSVSSSSGSSYESTTRKESIIQKVNTNNTVLNGLNAIDNVNIVTSVNGLSNSVKKANISKHEDEECDSGTVSDSSQDQEIVHKQTIKPKLEEKTVKVQLKTEILEVPLPIARIPESDSKIESPGILADHKLVLDKQPSASSGSRKDSVSSMSSVSSYESTNKIEKIKLSARRSQELSKRDIENQLQEAFANLDGESQEDNLKTKDAHTKKEIPLSISANTDNASSNLEYKIPAPPAGFKDGSADDTSSVSSDSTQEDHIKMFSAFNDSQPSSLTEAKNPSLIEAKNPSLTEAKNPSLTEAKNPALVADTKKVVQLPIPGESTDFNSYDRKNKIITEKKNIVNDSSKQSVINELKFSLKETNNNEPRIVDVTHKVPVTTMVVPTKKVNYPTESQVPRKDSVNSVSSYESCGESSDLQKVLSRDHRSASESSYDSAPPPIPEQTYPDDYDVKASRSSSISSTNSAASSAKIKPPAMNFSISTYSNRADEISYDKKLVKSESFSHQVRPGKSNLSKAESFTVQTAQYKSEFSSNVLTEEKEDVNEVPFQNSEINKSNSNESQVRSSSLGRVSSFNSKVYTKEKEDLKEIPIQSTHVNKFINSDSQIRSSSLGRVSSFNEKSNSSKNTSDNFIKPELLRQPRRLQNGGPSEPLERTASMVDLSHPQSNLRRAQSDIDVTEDSLKSEEVCNKTPSNLNHTLTNTKPSDNNPPSVVAQEQNNNTTPLMNMHDMEQMQKALGSGIRDPSMVPMMPDSRLAEEFVKLQQDFFRWQQQLLQNQHLLHSRVAPIASNPPSLQSVGVLRDIMSQSTSNLQSQSTSNLAENRENEKLKSERLADVKVEREIEENNSDNYQSRSVRSLSRPWLSQSTQDVSGSTEESSITTSNRKTYTNQPTRRWGPGEEPAVRVGAWGERSQAVGVQQDKDHYTSASSRSRSTQDLSTAHGPQGTRRWTPPKTFISPQPFSRSQADNVGFESKPYQRNQQQHVQSQSNATDQSASEVFWKELQARRSAFGLQESEAAVEEPQRPPRRTIQNHIVNGDTVDAQENENSSKPLTYFGQSNGPSEPQSYYYNGKKPSPSALSKVANNASVSRPRDVESETSGARYTSVVTLSSDKSGLNQGASAPKDKVRSVVQLNNSDNRPQLRTNPVVRGFRQPVEEEKQGTFQSRIISNSSNTQQASQQQTRPLSQGYSAPHLASNPSQYAYNTTSYQGPTASRLVSAVSGAALRDSMTPSGTIRSSSPASSHQSNTTTTSKASAGTVFPSVKLRPVTNTSPRASPPVEIVAPSVASTTSTPPAPPPAPVAPPPPPAAPLAPLAPGERRTASGKIIKPAKKGPTLDPREELMMAIRGSAGGCNLKKTRGN